jgi:hypothetical protein
MPGWTQDDLDRRNLEIFRTSRPAGLQIQQEQREPDGSEAEIEAECCRLLVADGWRTLKCDPVSDRRRGKGFGEPGMADTLALRYSRKGAASEVLWVEWKARGGRVKKHQLEWHARERARGAMTAIAGVDFPPSVQGFIGWYRNCRLARALW